MAMGAFLAGVLLAESNFRHQLEADIEPFRGMLLGLFFMSVGMSIDARSCGSNGLFLLVAAPAVILGKTLRSSSSCHVVRLAGPRRRPGGRASVAGGRIRLRPASGRGGPRPSARNEARLVTALAAITMFVRPDLRQVRRGRLDKRLQDADEIGPEMLPDAQQ